MKAWSILYNFIIPYLCCLHISHNTNNLETLISYIQLPYFCLMIKLFYLSTGYYIKSKDHLLVTTMREKKFITNKLFINIDMTIFFLHNFYWLPNSALVNVRWLPNRSSISFAVWYVVFQLNLHVTQNFFFHKGHINLTLEFIFIIKSLTCPSLTVSFSRMSAGAVTCIFHLLNSKSDLLLSVIKWYGKP